MHRRNNNRIYIDDVVHLILLKEGNSQLIDNIKSLGELDSKIVIRKYYLNQRLKDISKNIDLKINNYA